jgi:hypothetical protein
VSDGTPARIDLAAVKGSLRRVQRDFERINARLSFRREPLSSDVLENMLAGYAFVDALAAAPLDVFALGNLKYLLELNTIVLCGTDPVQREPYAGHIEATERRFYEERKGGIQDLIMSYILIEAGQPPFVLSVHNATAYFEPSTMIKDTEKKSVTMLFRLSRIRSRLARLLREDSDRTYLAKGPACSPR